jgi:hypothetical protein
MKHLSEPEPPGDAAEPAPPAELLREATALVDDYRSTCLFFLRPDYYPTTRDEILRVLSAIERNGDLEAYRRCAALRRWFSPTSSATSAGS